MKFRIGDKVVPHRKSIGSKGCRYLNMLEEKVVGFLYVVGKEEKRLVLNAKPREEVGNSGSYYHPSDLAKYVDLKDKSELL